MTDEKPWKTPAVGDTLTLPDGRVWRVTVVHPRGKHQYPGEERISYEYTDAAGSKRTAMPMLREFVARIGRQVRRGFTYERAKDSPLALVLVAARDMLKFGEHDGECSFDEAIGKCPAHVEAFEERRVALENALAMYDKAQS